MPRLDENTERQLHDIEHGARSRTRKAWDSFSNFALRDNVLEVAVGLMYVSWNTIVENLGANIAKSRCCIHCLRKLACIRYHPPTHLTPTIPQPQPLREIRDSSQGAPL